MAHVNPDVLIAGGGAAAFFAAITCAEAAPGLSISLYEKGPEFLQKVRISGGGRCNVTHACFEPGDFVTRYPRGRHELIGPLHSFNAEDTVQWFQDRGVKLKKEQDGRMFPVSNTSRTIVECLLRSAEKGGVQLFRNRGVEQVRVANGIFTVGLASGESVTCKKLLLATGGCRTPALGALAASLGHTLEPPVPSLFTFHIVTPWVRSLAGLSVEHVKLSVPGTSLREGGPLLFTHWGLSGPVVLRISAWGARELHAKSYVFPLEICWFPHSATEELERQLRAHAAANSARYVQNAAIGSLPNALWRELVRESGVSPVVRWGSLNADSRQRLNKVLLGTRLEVTGKSLNKDEFVTCGGVRLSEVNFKTMESKLCPRLYFAGELLDIDGLTGGFNFQAAWTTGWIAGRAMVAANS
jgi:predicted Rossmann fold flavoprotein